MSPPGLLLCRAVPCPSCTLFPTQALFPKKSKSFKCIVELAAIGAKLLIGPNSLKRCALSIAPTCSCVPWGLKHYETSLNPLSEDGFHDDAKRTSSRGVEGVQNRVCVCDAEHGKPRRGDAETERQWDECQERCLEGSRKTISPGQHTPKGGCGVLSLYRFAAAVVEWAIDGTTGGRR
jgi:hypothetical protein